MSMKYHARGMRRNYAPLIILIVLVLAVVTVGLIIFKSINDKNAAQENADHFATLISTGDFSGAASFMQQTETELRGKVLEDTQAKMDEILVRVIKEYSKLALQGMVDTAGYQGLAAFAPRFQQTAYDELDRVTQLYLDGKLDSGRLDIYFNSMSIFGFNEKLEQCRARASVYYITEEGFSQARQFVLAKDYKSALDIYRSIPQSDPANYAVAQEEIGKIIDSYRTQAVDHIKNLMTQEKYESAIASIEEALSYVPEDAEIADFQAQCNVKLAEIAQQLVEYTGTVEHVFFHCLIAFPEIGFSSPSMIDALDRDCVTVYEFKQILQSLYDRDYVLIDANNLYVDVEQNGQTVLKKGKIMAPKGKKPLILSIDDMVYDSRKAGTGMVDKLILNEQGNVVTYTKHANGTEVISDDNEIVPIVDKFVAEHPDFSVNGAKGVIALTGFQGILGYRTYRDSPNRDAEIEAVRPIVERLKQTGWVFGSHSYSHADMGKASLAKVIDDTDKWTNEVKSLVGDTKLFFWPYGSRIESDKEAYQKIVTAGFKVFFGVGYRQPFMRIEANNKTALQDRRNIDGFTLRLAPSYFTDFYVTADVFDPLRPASVGWMTTYLNAYGTPKPKSN